MKLGDYLAEHKTAGLYSCACFRHDADFMVVEDGVVKHVVMDSDDFMNTLYDAIMVHGDSVGHVDNRMIEHLNLNRCGCSECPLFAECKIMNLDI